jgi:hypothetical protein
VVNSREDTWEALLRGRPGTRTPYLRDYPKAIQQHSWQHKIKKAKTYHTTLRGGVTRISRWTSQADDGKHVQTRARVRSSLYSELFRLKVQSDRRLHIVGSGAAHRVKQSRHPRLYPLRTCSVSKETAILHTLDRIFRARRGVYSLFPVFLDEG